MEAWDLPLTAGDVFLDFTRMSALLLAATVLRAWSPWLQKGLVPNNLTAGVLGLLLGANGLGLLDLTSDRLGAMIYHLLALLFIAYGLRSPKKRLGRSSLAFGMIYILTYLIQGILGAALAFALIHTFLPDLFPGIGVMLPLAFGMNPGIAYTIGKSWEPYGFTDGGIVGLSFAALGFVTAYSVGLYFTKRYALGRLGGGESGSESEAPPASGLLQAPDASQAGASTTSPEVIESWSLHLALIGVCYGLLILLIQGLEWVLVTVGAAQEVSTLWSFHFVLAPVVAFVVRAVVDRLGLGRMVDDPTMTRTGNVMVDFMIVASVAAISFQVVLDYLVPLLLLSAVVAVATWWFIRKAVDQAFREFKEERLITIFGNLTGTLQSGLVLLRVLDPHMKTPASYNLVYGSGLALALGFPLLVLINMPTNYFTDLEAGFAWVVAGMAGYLLLLGAVWWAVFVRRQAR